MTRSKFKFILLISILMLSSVIAPNIASADTHVLPKVGDSNAPTLDGNITSTEWNTSVTFTTTLHDREITVFVTTDSTNLYIGFNMSSSNFVSVNDTIPGGNYSLGYNNATHDWFALTFDNNLDKEVTDTTIGTADALDDAIVLDQYVTGAYDALTNGSETMNFIPDETQTYTDGQNSTVLDGRNGSDNVNSDRNITSSQVIYEISKPLNSGDINGSDFMLSQLGILQFRLYSFTNSQSNDTLSSAGSNAEVSEWFALRVNDDGDALTSKAPANTTVNIIGHSFDSTEVDALLTLSELYGFDIHLQSTSNNVSYTDYDLNVFIVGDDSAVTNAEIDRLRTYIRSGGNAVVLLGDSSSSQNVAEIFEISYLSNSVVAGVNESLIEVDQFTEDLPFVTQDVLTNRTVNTVEYSTSALNVTELNDDSNRYLLGQEYMAYDLFNTPDGIVYDSSNDGYVNDTESFEGLSLGVAIDLLKGGRVSVLPSTSLVADGSIAQADNLVYLLKLLPWNSRIVSTLDIQSTDVDKRTIVEGQTIAVTVNMTDGLDNALSLPVTVLVEVKIGGNVINTAILSQVGDTSEYVGDVTITENGFMELEITGFSSGYGYAEGETQNVFVESDVRSFNDLSDLSPIIVIFFLISLTAFALVYTRVRNF